MTSLAASPLTLCSSFTALSLSQSSSRASVAGCSSGVSFSQLALRSASIAGRRNASEVSRARAALAVGAEEAEEDQAPAYPPFAAFKIHGTGRRKTAVARVGLVEGSGRIYVNDLTLQEYFQNQALLVQAVRLPLSSLGYENKYDLVIKTHGGGLSAQSQAIVMGIARALCVANAANRPPLKAQGMLTRDARSVERKKYGLKKARKAPQYSKR